MEVSADKFRTSTMPEVVPSGDPDLDRVRQMEIQRIKDRAARQLVEKVVDVQGVPYGGDAQGHKEVVTVPGPDDFWYEGQV